MNKSEILKKHQLWLNDQKGGERADLSRVNLSRVNLSRADLSGVKLVCANLSRANLSGVKLTGADLSGADLSGANLSGADLSHAKLFGANLIGANLRRAKLRYALLRNCIGNGREIKTIIADPWNIVLTKDVVWVGCRKFTKDEWTSLVKTQTTKLNTEEVETQWATIINAMFETF